MKYNTLNQYKEAIRLAHTEWVRSGNAADELALFKLIAESWQFVIETAESMHYWGGFISVFLK
jgi:hypothetical protein